MNNYLMEMESQALLPSEEEVSSRQSARLNCSMLYISIYDFYSSMEPLPSEQILQLSNDFLTAVSKIIIEYNGKIYCADGQSIGAVFGAPLSSKLHAHEAIFAAFEIKNQLITLRDKFKQFFAVNDFNVKISINSGPAVFGYTGYTETRVFSVLGKNVDLARKINLEASPDEILIGKNTYNLINQRIKAEKWGTASLENEQYEFYKVIDAVTSKNEEAPKLSNQIRKYERIPYVSIIKIARENSTDTTENGMIQNISRGGMKLSSKHKYQIGDTIFLSFNLGHNYHFKNIKAVIRYINTGQLDKSNYYIGIEFCNFKNKDFQQLEDFIHIASRIFKKIKVGKQEDGIDFPLIFLPE